MGGMTRLLLLLWAGVTVGKVVDLQKRILGGQNCPIDQRLFHVQLRISYPSDTFVCGGSLISAQWILTAAHCWDPSLYAVVGVHPGPGTRMEVKAHFFKENHDIMLLEITNPNPNTIQNNYVKLPVSTSHLNVGTVFQIAGHTLTTLDQNNMKVSQDSGTLLCAITKGAECTALDNCVKKNPQLWSKVSQAHRMCFQSPGVDVSGGDSGGGVVDAAGMIYGVISFGSNSACTTAAASMSVFHYMGWIKATTGII